mgnify:CR=1 FL=1
MELKKKLYILLVNDASTVNLDLPKFDLNLTILRIQKNIKWNSSGAKNLGVLAATSARIIVSDIDHWFPKEALQFCMKLNEVNDKVFAFNQHEIFEDGTEMLLFTQIFFSCQK